MRIQTNIKGTIEAVNINRRKAIKLKCLDCSGGYHAEVKNCPLTDCPLYEFRTGEGKQDADKRNKAIRSKCMECTCGQRNEIRECVNVWCALWPYRMANVDKSIAI